jgi:hypothetical protein
LVDRDVAGLWHRHSDTGLNAILAYMT